jgi:hypothetical protein
VVMVGTANATAASAATAAATRVQPFRRGVPEEAACKCTRLPNGWLPDMPISLFVRRSSPLLGRQLARVVD